MIEPPYLQILATPLSMGIYPWEDDSVLHALQPNTAGPGIAPAHPTISSELNTWDVPQQMDTHIGTYGRESWLVGGGAAAAAGVAGRTRETGE